MASQYPDPELSQMQNSAWFGQQRQNIDDRGNGQSTPYSYGIHSNSVNDTPHQNAWLLDGEDELDESREGFEEYDFLGEIGNGLV